MNDALNIGKILDRIPAEQRTCDQHGEYMARLFRDNWTRCPKCVEAERELREAQEREQAKRARIESFLRDDSGIPRRFADCTIDGYQASNDGQRRAKEFALKFSADLAEKAENGRSAIFCGMPGNGKTHLACAIAKAAIYANRSAHFTTAIRLVRRIKDTWRKDAEETETQAIEFFTWPSLLVLDEVGVQFGSETEKMLLFDVLNDRYEQRKSVILVSNLGIDGVKDFLGERVFDRLREDGGVYIPFTWDSYRGAA